MKPANRHAESIRTSSFLSKLPMIGLEQEEDVQRLAPSDLIPLLQKAGIDFVLAGAHGIAGWLREPRATQDVDFIVRMKDRQKAADAILARHPDFEMEKHPDVWRLKQGQEYLVDLILTRAPLFKRVISEYTEIRMGKCRVKIPRIEAALAMKFASMTGHYRNYEKKFIDAGDFASMVRKNQNVDLSLLAELGELVCAGGGADVVKYLEDARAGKPLEI